LVRLGFRPHCLFKSKLFSAISHLTGSEIGEAQVNLFFWVHCKWTTGIKRFIGWLAAKQ